MLASWLLNKMLRPDLPQIFEKMMIGRIWNFEHRSTEVGDESPLTFLYPPCHRVGSFWPAWEAMSSPIRRGKYMLRILGFDHQKSCHGQKNSRTRKTLGRLGTSTGPPSSSFTLRNWAYTPFLRNAKVFRDLFLAIDFWNMMPVVLSLDFFFRTTFCVFLHLQFIQLIISINQSLSHTPQQLNNMLHPISHFNL